MEGYMKARSYAYVAVKDHYLDVVHDAYLTWYKKTKRNLFLEPERTMINVVLYQVIQHKSKGMRMYKGEKIVTYQDVDVDSIPSSSIRINYDFDRMVSKLSYKDIAILLSQGYTQKDISCQMQVSTETIYRRVKVLKQELGTILK